MKFSDRMDADLTGHLFWFGPAIHLTHMTNASYQIGKYSS